MALTSAELYLIGFNAMNKILWVVWRYILVKEKKSKKMKIMPKQIWSNKKCLLYKTYRKFLMINY